VKTIGIDQDITIADDIRFVLNTTDSNNCLKTPYQITNVTIYFITREFTDSTATEYNREYNEESLVREYEAIKKEICTKFKQNVVAATTQNISLFGLQNIDGIDIEEGNRVLVKDQNASRENGIYVASENIWNRSEDANSKENILNGIYLFVDNGIDNINTGWVLSAPKQIQVNSTSLSFFRFSTEDEPKNAPDDFSRSKLEFLKKQIEESKKKSNFYYKDAIAVKTFGGNIDPETGEIFPAWLNPALVPEDISDKIEGDNILAPYEEENGEIVDGKFTIDWQPFECREGDYFICWSWMPNLAGDIFSNHIFFSLEGNGQLTTSIPTHLASPKKYELLMDRYLPEMFKVIISNADLTPKVLQEFNYSVAKGFTFIENQANQMIDLLDANSTHEQLLPLLSNMLNLKLKSNDPTLWRRQIKKAIPNYKKKGSIEGLKSALSDAGVKFLSIKKLWQVVSKYTYQEHFEYKGSNRFRLSKNIVLPIDLVFKLWRRNKDSDWVDLTQEESDWHSSYIQIEEEVNDLIWIGPELQEGDSIRILYKFRSMPEGERTIDEYIRLLPLMDQRDERSQEYPVKNWNTHLIEEDDDLFERIIPVRHPLADPIVWGRVRTEFPYSENAYNMEEYNGSKRDSYNPCDIDKDFIDPCSQCLSSKFTIDLEVEKLSDESYIEANKIIEEYMPFHAIVHSFNLAGAINEFIRPSAEKIDALVTFSREDFLLAGEGQHIFNRDVQHNQLKDVKRNLLADYSVVTNGSETTWSGILKNQNVALYSSGVNTEDDLFNENFSKTSQAFESKNINTSNIEDDPFESSNILEVLGATNKNYSLSSFGSSAKVHQPVEQNMIGPLFEYRISNKIADFYAKIDQSDQIIFSDNDADFGILGIITQHDVNMSLSNLEPWKLRFLDKIYLIENILPDATLLIKEESVAAPIEGWQLIDRGSIVKYSNSESQSQLTTIKLGLVEVNDSENTDKLKIGDYVYIDWQSLNKQYRIKSFNKFKNKFYIENYEEGDIGWENIKIYRRIVQNKVGQFCHEGIEFVANENIESILGISNGINQDPQNILSNNLKENYLLIRDQKYYSIIEIEGSKLKLNGPIDDWTTEGEEAEFSIYKFEKQNLDLKERQLPNVPGYKFESIDRSGSGTIDVNQENYSSLSLAILNSSGSDKIDLINQNESIEFDIEYKKEE